jgi:hypothetical protein
VYTYFSHQPPRATAQDGLNCHFSCADRWLISVSSKSGMSSTGPVVGGRALAPAVKWLLPSTFW